MNEGGENDDLRTEKGCAQEKEKMYRRRGQDVHTLTREYGKAKCHIITIPISHIKSQWHVRLYS